MATKARSWTWRELVLRARDVETGEQQIERSTVWVPPDEARRRTQLIEATHQRHPDARFKSFVSSVASFVAGKHLVVARYGGAFEPPETERAPDDWDQEALFGDAA
ncbi:MAG: hypothetical protein MSC31_16880 [Solirubrobacteraceae bacterium MAG38_C4-C5]|nr:hypothetical protein [Candidatus Siliceabacter maunaloa]